MVLEVLKPHLQPVTGGLKVTAFFWSVSQGLKGGHLLPSHMLRGYYLYSLDMLCKGVVRTHCKGRKFSREVKPNT